VLALLGQPVEMQRISLGASGPNMSPEILLSTAGFSGRVIRYMDISLKFPNNIRDEIVCFVCLM
jgi:hypothetical protein